MKKIILSLLLAATASAFAQSSFKGTLVSTDQKPISAANIILITLPDSTLVKGAISDVKGVFELPNTAENKKIIIKITHLEYEPKVLTPSQSQLGIIELTPATNQLGEVVLTARRPIIEQKGTRISTNVAQSSLQKMPQMGNLISFLPGVTRSYSSNSGFEVFGKGNPVFYINNRKSHDISEVYRLSPQEIESIAIETQPGAEHDNSVGAVIYIKLKKKPGDGLSGMIAGQTNLKEKGNNSYIGIDLKYRKGKTDFLFTAFPSLDFANKSESQRALLVHAPSNEWQVNTSELNENNGKHIYVKTGLAHEFSDKHFAGFTLHGNINPFAGHSYTDQAMETHQNNTLLSKGFNHYDRFNQNKSLYGNAYYEGVLSDNLKLQTDIYYLGIRSNNQSDIVEKNLLTNTTTNKYTHSDASSDWWSIKTTFTQKIGKSTGLSYGLEASKLRRDEDYRDSYRVSPRIDNKETRSSAFVSLTLPIKQTTLKAGLRYEYADFGYYENDQKSDIKSKIYRDFLPNISFSFPWNKSQIAFSYARKIKRPAFYELSDYEAYESPFLYNRGNPYIAPRLSEEVSLLTTYKILSFALNYQYIRKGIYQDYRLSSIPNVVEKSLKNFDDFQTLKAVVSVQHSFNFWQPKLTFTVGKQFATNVFEQNNPIVGIEMQNELMFSEKWMAIIGAKYRSKGSLADTYYYKNQTVIDWVVMRTFCDGKLNTFIGMDDIFNSNNSSAEVTNRFISNRFNNNSFNPVYFVGLSYRFNSTNSRLKGQSANEDDKGRM